MLVLDEVLGLIDQGIVSEEEILQLVSFKDDYRRLVLTGWELPEAIARQADIISRIDLEKDLE